MTNHNHNHSVACPVCGQQKRTGEMMHGDLVRPGVQELIRKKIPQWQPKDNICMACLNHVMAEQVEAILTADRGELSQLEREVIEHLKSEELMTENVNIAFEKELSFGDRLADKVAEFGGSWKFIITFGVVMFAWITINTIAMFMKPFDPYPYILLNLVLSCLASMQAPIIMMSQNRQESKDRLRGEHDFRINLKAEVEIRQINAKVDQILTHQWQRLMEIQQIQTELMEEVMQLTGKNRD